MKTKELIEKHEKAINLLNRIELLELRIESNEKSLAGYPGQIQKTRNDLEKEISWNKERIELLKGDYDLLIECNFLKKENDLQPKTPICSRCGKDL